MFLKVASFLGSVPTLLFSTAPLTTRQQ